MSSSRTKFTQLYKRKFPTLLAENKRHLKLDYSDLFQCCQGLYEAIKHFPCSGLICAQSSFQFICLCLLFTCPLTPSEQSYKWLWLKSPCMKWDNLSRPFMHHQLFSLALDTDVISNMLKAININDKHQLVSQHCSNYFMLVIKKRTIIH